MQETIKDLAAQKKEYAEDKNNEMGLDFAYRSATREIALNIKVSFRYFMVTSRVYIIIYLFLYFLY